MTMMRPYEEMAGDLRSLYRAIDERDKLATFGDEIDCCSKRVASLAGAIWEGDPRLLPEENDFLRHLLVAEGFSFDDDTVTVPDPIVFEPWPEALAAGEPPF